MLINSEDSPHQTVGNLGMGLAQNISFVGPEISARQPGCC